MPSGNDPLDTLTPAAQNGHATAARTEAAGPGGTPPALGDVGRRMASGAVWMVALKLVERSIGMLSTVVLARLLVPADFGVVAMAMSVVAVLELANSFGFDTAIIQNADADRRHYDTAWTLNVMLGAASATVLVLLAVPASRFYDEPRVAGVMAVLAIAMLVQGFENIGVVALRKHLDLGRDVRFLLARKLAGFVVTIGLALAFRSYWALVFGVLAARSVGVVVSYLAVPYRPRPTLVACAELVAFSRWLLVNNVFLFVNGRSADFIIGKLGGPHALGLFTLASEIANLPTTDLIAPINRAIFPGYARMSADVAALRRGFLDVIAVISLVAIPAGAAVAGVAEGVVGLALGPQWASAVPVIRVVAVYGVLTALQTNGLYVYVALGRPEVVMRLGALNLVVLLPALVAATAWHGGIGAAWALAGTAALLTPASIATLLRHLGLRVRDVLGVAWRPVLSTAAMVLAMRLAQMNAAWGTGMVHDAGAVLGALGAGAVVYVAVLLGAWVLAGKPDGAERIILERISAKLVATGA